MVVCPSALERTRHFIRMPESSVNWFKVRKSCASTSRMHHFTKRMALNHGKTIDDSR